MAVVILAIWGWVLVASGITWLVFAHDKRAAVLGTWRVPERTLLTLALIGGTPGAFAAQRILRHKTHKRPFATILVLIAVLQMAALAMVLASGLSDFVLHTIAGQQ